MAYSILKIAAYGFAWISPILILVWVSRNLQRRSIGLGKRRLTIIILIPIVWVLGLVASFLGQYFHAAGWLSTHPDGLLTEQDMQAFGDYPNVFAGWVMLGWVPILGGLLLSTKRELIPKQSRTSPLP